MTLSLALLLALSPVGAELDDHAALITHFGGKVVDPTKFTPDVDGFQKYLGAVGVVHFSAKEITRPFDEVAARKCRVSELLPEQSRWPRGAVLALFADRVRAHVDEAVFLRNWWRPDCYNKAVGGAARGDHPDADAVDLDFRSEQSRARAQRFVCESYWLAHPRLNLSVGMGGNTLHVGFLSERGRRFWKYNSYVALPSSGACW